ncbi:conserved hypothetical protein [Sulfurimonas denitrificans DSM 1251]|uniref:Uncharacterized protein n=1 Tax=Sulfurimonas denitrificans (strain ATCC 33889 / DSM 1251) TaxID=326298 RepID=Q30PQ7_SULDN|nr:TorF family putative porin [Sulfurimonas denitrificans]ABB45024.1 conserved hypothetical protein [Sulfurimonas denitrificans DSM 1251]
MKLSKITLTAALAVTVLFGADEASDVTISSKMALTSNYIWRGMTQSDNSAALQGALDLGYKGLYLGVFGSNVEFGAENRASLELDIYGGYAGELYGIGYDVGLISYSYPNQSKELNFAEAYIGLSKDFEVVNIGAKYYSGIKTDELDPTDAWEVSLSAPLVMELTLSALYGDYDKVGNYYNVGITKALGKFEVGISYVGIEMDNNPNQDNLIATISTSF